VKYIAALLVLLLPGPAAADPAYLQELIQRSRELKLAERPEWRKLMHYLPRAAWFGSRSLIDSPNFFLAPDGKTNLQAELEATLAAFWSPLEETTEQQNPQCRFIARRAWLDREIGFDRRRLPLRECPRFNAWVAAMDPKTLTLVFPSAYLNSPASMYGHTLLRVDARDQDDRTRLLAYTINFAAVTEETNGLLFAVNGLLGGYPGNYSILPYYIKVREYTHLENRDIWEYELAFTPEEIERVLQHAWELGPAWFQYFFFDENCSYHLLALLQVARPELDLVAPFSWWALPIDTVRETVQRAGLLARATYRPSQATIVAKRLEGLSGDERDLVQRLSRGEARPGDARLKALPAGRAAATLETAYDYVNYRRVTNQSVVADPAALARELLLARSAIDAPSQAPAIPAPATRPDQGHGTSRAALSAGRRAGRDFLEVRTRASFHDMMDPEPGYTRGAQMEFFSLALRSLDPGGARIEEFTPIQVLSLAPRDEFFQSRSWRVSTGWRREFLADGSEPLVAVVEGGAGGAWSAARGKILAYAMADGTAKQHHRLEEGYALALGGRFGAYIDPTPSWRVHAYVRALGSVAGDPDTPRWVGLENRLALGRDLALRFDLARSREHARLYNAVTLSLLWYL
jgi:hypothetical protein